MGPCCLRPMKSPRSSVINSSRYFLSVSFGIDGLRKVTKSIQLFTIATERKWRKMDMGHRFAWRHREGRAQYWLLRSTPPIALLYCCITNGVGYVRPLALRRTATSTVFMRPSSSIAVDVDRYNLMRDRLRWLTAISSGLDAFWRTTNSSTRGSENLVSVGRDRREALTVPTARSPLSIPGKGEHPHNNCP